MKAIILLPVIFLFISACKAPLIQPHAHGKHLLLSANAWIEIKQTVMVDADNARAYFQNGHLIPSSALDLYEVNCELEVRDVLETQQSISPGKLKIIKAQQDQSPIVFLSPHVIQVAAMRDEGPSDTKRFWKFTLRSAQQPNIMHLICRGVQDSPANAEIPNVEEMQFALGNYVDLHLF